VKANYPARRGFTLVEMLVFIVIVSFAAYALFRSFGSVLQRSPTAAQLTQAMQLAQERMELIQGQRDSPLAGRGFNNTVDLDPCNVGAPTVCTNTFGYAVTSAGTAPGAPVAWPPNPATASYKLVTVTVSLGGITLAQQSAVLTNYLP
jgi:prepilin-type N-terminal cleavage/methylation domain-containing protein